MQQDVGLLIQALDAARKAGSIVVVAAGNETVDIKDVPPAGCNGVISVAASDQRGHLRPFRRCGHLGRKSVVHSGHNASNLRCLIVSLVAVDEIEKARALTEQLLRFSPTFRLAAFRSRTPLRGDVRDLFVERLQQAGLPD